MSDLPMILVTGLIALFAAAQFFLQHLQHRHDVKVAKANHRISLYEMRLKYFLEVEGLIRDFFTKGEPSIEAVMKLRFETRNAEFLFPKAQVDFISELVVKGFAHGRATTTWEPLRARAYAGEKLNEEETAKKEAALRERQEIEDWFHQILESGQFKREFDAVLKIPEDF